MRIVAIGNNSYLARKWISFSHLKSEIEIFGHDVIYTRPNSLFSNAVVVNFCSHPELETRLLAPEELPERILAEKLSTLDSMLVTLSSRRVYAQYNGVPLSEDHPLSPLTIAGRNKLLAESHVNALLPERSIVLRLANIYGLEYEKERRTFMGRLIGSLKENKDILFDVSPETEKDFLPDFIFSKTLTSIVGKPKPGTFNIGSGLPSKIRDIASWVLEGWGGGSYKVSTDVIRDPFVLNVTKAASQYDLHCSLENIRDYCIKIGRDLRNHE